MGDLQRELNPNPGEELESKILAGRASMLDSLAHFRTLAPSDAEYAKAVKGLEMNLEMLQAIEQEFRGNQRPATDLLRAIDELHMIPLF